jgi:hypothetical protein
MQSSRTGEQSGEQKQSDWSERYQPAGSRSTFLDAGWQNDASVPSDDFESWPSLFAIDTTEESHHPIHHLHLSEVPVVNVEPIRRRHLPSRTYNTP